MHVRCLTFHILFNTTSALSSLLHIKFVFDFLQRLGVEISVSGFVFEEEDFIRPWEGQNDNLER